MNRVFFCITIGLCILTLGCQKEGGKANKKSPGYVRSGLPIKIGFSGPITGKQADYGKSVSQGAKLRIEEINAAGGIAGRKVELVVGDDAASPTQAVTVAQEFASNSDVLVVLGHFNSSCSNAAKPIYRAAKLPQLSYGSTNDDVTDGSEWTFRTPYKNSLQGRSLARFSKSVLKAQRVGIITENDAYGKSLASEFKLEAEALELSVDALESFDVEATDYRPLLIKIKPLSLDVILLAGFYPQIQVLIKQAREIGVTSKFVAGDGVGSSSEFIQGAGEAAEGIYCTGPFLIEQDREAIAKFRESYSKTFSTNPDSWAVYSYDAVGIVCKGIESGAIDRDSIRKYLASIDSAEKAYSGLVGPIYFDSQRNAVNKDVTIAVVRGGRFEVVEWGGE